MTYSFTNRATMGVTAVLFSLFLSGCAATAPGMDPVKGLDARQSDAIVIGRLRLIKNGKEVSLADDPFASAPRVHLSDVRHGRTVRAEVGENGEFAWPLHAEFYNVSGIEFLVNGRKVLFPTYLTIAASNEKEATYVGTITVETDVELGYYGLSAKSSTMTISDDCALLCDRQLADLGLNRDNLDIELVRPDVSLATARNR